MKTLNNLFAVASLFALLSFGACKEDTPDGGTDEVPGQSLEATWAVTDASNVSGPAADQFTGFSITINASASGVTYTTSGGGDPLVFPAQGTLIVEPSDDFDAGAEVLREPDNVPMTINLSQDGDVMDIDFTIDVGVNARVAGINGEYSFTLNRQGSTN